MKKLSLLPLAIASGACAVASTALRAVSLFLFYDKNLGYYQSHPIPIIANLLFALSIVFFGVAAIFLIKKNEKVDIPSKATGAVAILPIGALLLHAISQFVSTSKNGIPSLNANMSFAEKLVAMIPFLITVFAALSIAFFVLVSVIAFKKKPITAIAYVGLIPLIYVILLWANTHFEFNIPLNSTNKIFFYLACASALLFIYNEIATSCRLMIRSRFYYFSLFAAIITLSTASIPSVIAYLAGGLGEYYSLEGDIFFISLLLYATVRLITLLVANRKASEAEEATEEVAEEIAEEATEEVAEKATEEVTEEATEEAESTEQKQ